MISECDPSQTGRLADAYNVQAAQVPYDHPVDADALAAALAFPQPGFEDGRLFQYEESGRVVGFVNAGTIAGGDEPGPRQGLLRAFCFPRHRRDVGQALLHEAEAHLRSTGVDTIQACNYACGLSCTWYSHLKSCWEHVISVLGSVGYRIAEPWTLIMALRDYRLDEPVLTDAGIDVQVDDTPIFPGVSHGDLPTVAVRLSRDGRLIGGNEARPYYLPHWDRSLQDTCVTMGMGVDEDERGCGLGRYLMQRSLYEMQRRGVRHAILDVQPDNYTALGLYASMGYRTCYSAGQMVRRAGP